MGFGLIYLRQKSMNYHGPSGASFTYLELAPEELLVVSLSSKGRHLFQGPRLSVYI